MRETEFFKFIFFNVSSVLTAIVIALLIVVLVLGLKHRRRLAESDPEGTDGKMNAGIDSDDQAALREVGLASAGLGNVYQTSDESEKDDKGSA